MGAAKLDHVLNWCTALGIPAVTLWVCSTKNLQRSAQEVSGILAAIQDKLADLAPYPLVHQPQVPVRAAGRLHLLHPPLPPTFAAPHVATNAHVAPVLTIPVALYAH